MKIITLDTNDPENLYESLSEKGRKDLFAKLLQYEEPTYIKEEESHVGMGGFLVAVGLIIAIGLAI